MKLYVGNLNFRVTEDDLRELFAPFGTIDDLILLHDRETGRSRGFGFITLADDELAQKAIDQLHQQDYQGRDLALNQARPRTPGPAEASQGAGKFNPAKTRQPRHENPPRSVGGGYVGRSAATPKPAPGTAPGNTSETTPGNAPEEKSPTAPEAEPPASGGYRRGPHI